MRDSRRQPLPGRRHPPRKRRGTGPAKPYPKSGGASSRSGTAGRQARVSATLTDQQVTVVTGLKRGPAEDPGAAGNLSSLSNLALGAGIINIYVSLFVAANTVALSVGER